MEEGEIFADSGLTSDMHHYIQEQQQQQCSVLDVAVPCCNVPVVCKGLPVLEEETEKAVHGDSN